MKSLTKPKNDLVYGIAVNDANYFTQMRKKVKNESTWHVETIKWMCPYYSTWKNMLRRCYSSNKEDNPPMQTSMYVKNGSYSLISKVGWNNKTGRVNN